jgi:predicted protein tyrosine phosphatase
MTQPERDAPPIQDAIKELNNPQIPEVAATPQDTREPHILKQIIHLWQQLIKQGVKTTFIEAYDQFQRLLHGAPTERYSSILPGIHIGGQYSAKGWPILQARGVTSVVDMRDEYGDARHGLAPERYLYLPTVDNTAPSLQHLQQGITFIHDELARGGQVYIHCWEGVGRAPTMAAAYLVSTGLRPREAWGKIKACRPFIRPSLQQLEQLDRVAELYEVQVRRPLAEEVKQQVAQHSDSVPTP